MRPEQQEGTQVTHRPWQPRFGLGSLLLAMTVFSVMGAAAFYLAQYLRGGRDFQLAFILFTLATPVLLLVVVSSAYAVIQWYQRKSRRR